MPKVIHTHQKMKFEEVEKKPFKMDRKYRVCFEDDAIETSFVKLLSHECLKCRDVFHTFKKLDQHVRRQHQLFFCELCVEHLKIFTHERKLYSRPEYATHRRKGDPDDTSHKGHPLCEFCNDRFVDKDALFLHLRRDHYFCHFCDQDGIQQYYPGYNELRGHFKSEHFLCEDHGCQDQQFTNAFRTDIDLKAHRAERHSGNLSKAAAKQNRQVEVDLNFSRPTIQGQANRRRGRDRSPEEGYDQVDGREEERPPDLSAESFPSLGLAGPGSAVASSGGNLAMRVAMASGHNTRWSDGHRQPREEDFPQLPGASYSVPAVRQKPPSSSSGAVAKKKSPVEDFPSLGGPSKPIPAFQSKKKPSSAPIYRSNPNAPTSWSSAANVRTVSEQEMQEQLQQSSEKPSMTTLQKKKNVLSDNDFPGLETPSNPPIPKKEAPPAQKENKKKNKKKGNVVKDLKQEQQSSLKSVADLIPVDPKIKHDSEEEWQQVKAKEANLKNEAKSEENSSSKANGAIPGLNFERVSISGPTSGPPPGLTKPSTAKPPVPKEDFPTLGSSSRPMSANFRPSSSAEHNLEWKNVTTSTSTPVQTKAPPAKTISAPRKDDFPALGPSSKAMSANFSRTKGSSTVAWGGATNLASNNTKPPPPGFGTRGKVKKSPAATFRQPENFNERNAQLLSAIMKIMGGKSLEFSQFKKASGQFRKGEMKAEEYYESFLESVANKEDFLTIFPELLVLLPDIEKQKELLLVHEKQFPSVGSLSPCPSCDQVLSDKDFHSHVSNHDLDSDFPALG